MPQRTKPSFNSVADHSTSNSWGLVRFTMNDAPIDEARTYSDMSDEILLAKIAESERQALEPLYNR